MGKPFSQFERRGRHNASFAEAQTCRLSRMQGAGFAAIWMAQVPTSLFWRY
jgi:hypothetical protein